MVGHYDDGHLELLQKRRDAVLSNPHLSHFTRARILGLYPYPVDKPDPSAAAESMPDAGAAGGAGTPATYALPELTEPAPLGIAQDVRWHEARMALAACLAVWAVSERDFYDRRRRKGAISECRHGLIHILRLEGRTFPWIARFAQRDSGSVQVGFVRAREKMKAPTWRAEYEAALKLFNNQRSDHGGASEQGQERAQGAGQEGTQG